MNDSTRITVRKFPPKVTPAPLTALPFVAPRKGRGADLDLWRGVKAKDYLEECEIGHQWACDFMQYIVDDPRPIHCHLGWIVEAMGAAERRGVSNGFRVGFCAALERALRDWASRTSPHTFIERSYRERAAA